MGPIYWGLLDSESETVVVRNILTYAIPSSIPLSQGFYSYIPVFLRMGVYRNRRTIGVSLSHKDRIVSTTPTLTTIFSYPSSCGAPEDLLSSSSKLLDTPRSARSNSVETVVLEDSDEEFIVSVLGVVLAVIANIVNCNINIIMSMASNLNRLVGPSASKSG